MTTEEKLDRILIGQARLETQVDSLEKRLTANDYQTNNRIAGLEKWRQGNGVVGVDKKIDRLEQTEIRRGGHIKILYTGVIGIIGSLIIAGIKFYFFGGL